MIERFNRTLLSMLSLFVDDNQLNWDLLLPYVMMAYRSSIHASTGFTPYKVLFGQEIVLPVDVMLDVDHRETFASVSEYVAGLADTLSTVVGAVKRHQAKASGQQKTNFDFRANFQYYSVGELVWLRNKAKKRGVCPKLQRRYKGPFAILEQVSEVLYRIKQVEGGPETVVHFNRLKPFVPSTLVAGVPLPNAEEVSPVLGPGVSMGEEHRPRVPGRRTTTEDQHAGLVVPAASSQRVPGHRTTTEDQHAGLVVPAASSPRERSVGLPPMQSLQRAGRGRDRRPPAWFTDYEVVKE
ncbi:hypothetical protein DPEC_G00006060 [Dallia pectoralis]|uniref:Uncharacterized protein n=1 Tax=Dallia pectoralis TaxID=75939 RepID=A0ACC2HK19_DALPE|nr:hypothetical protein DPEC_G00006060 [Dallia pectoralis]